MIVPKFERIDMKCDPKVCTVPAWLFQSIADQSHASMPNPDYRQNLQTLTVATELNSFI